MFPSSLCNRANSRARFTFFVGLTFFAASAFAQWPTSYTAPKILGGGTSVRAGDVKTYPGGGAYVTFANINEATHQVEIQKYSNTGEQLFPISNIGGDLNFAVSLKLLEAPNSSSAELGVLMKSAQPAPGSGAVIMRYQHVKNDGDFYWAVFSESIIPFGGTNFQGDRFATLIEHTVSHKFYIFSYGSTPSDGIPLEAMTHIDDAVLYAFPDDSMISCFTKRTLQPDTPRKVWSVGANGSVIPHVMGTAYPLDSTPLVDQSHPQVAPINESSAITTWLGEVDGKSDLYAAVVNSNGAILSPARNCFENVQDYVVTSSTLGLPVFAAVVRASENPRVESLVGGLINPNNGGTLTIPVSDVTGVKVKALRQEAGGDFSLVYSVPENGTNLLKVRRISGVDASTLWETTVANLGWASDEIIERYPNTWVDGNADNVLYILARYDEPNTANSSFQLVRLQADGAMGGD